MDDPKLSPLQQMSDSDEVIVQEQQDEAASEQTLSLRRAFLREEIDSRCVGMATREAHTPDELAKNHLESLAGPAFTAILCVDLACNRLSNLPAVLGSLRSLTFLDASHNRLKGLPGELAQCTMMKQLTLHSNSLRPHLRSLPADLLCAWPSLQNLDLRFNEKVNGKPGVEEDIRAKLPARCSLHLSRPRQKGRTRPNGNPGVFGEGGTGRESVCLRSQLEPLSTPTLRWRLAHLFQCSTDPDLVPRSTVLDVLVESYEAASSKYNGGSGGGGDDVGLLLQKYISPSPPRVVRKSVIVSAPGVPLEPTLAHRLLLALRATQWDKVQNDRPTVEASGYIMLRRPRSALVQDRPCSMMVAASAETKTPAHTVPERKSVRQVRLEKREAAKRSEHKALWEAACAVWEWWQSASMADLSSEIGGKEPSRAMMNSYTAVIFTRNFRGSPHVDTHDVDCQVACSLGDFDHATGRLCVEVDPCTVAELDTRERMVLFDGRFVHWVTPATGGDRFSVVWYRTEGPVVKKSSAVPGMDVVLDLPKCPAAGV